MFSKPAVRSVAQIKKGLLARAFERGGQAEYKKMELLIEWRLAACRHANRQALQDLETKYNIDEFNETPQEDSRGLNAFNLVAHVEGRKDSLRLTPTLAQMKAALKAEIAAKAPQVAHHNKVMDIIWNAPQFDLKAIRNSRPDAPIIIDRTPVLHCRRNLYDTVWQEVSEPNSTGSEEVMSSDRINFKGGVKPTFH